jgi:colanic acid/amylovoran biosynthesis glycosyltransferase
LNVAFFVTSFPTLSETFIANQIIALQNSGHKVTIFSKERAAGDKVHQMIVDAGLLAKTFYLCDLPKTRVAKIRLLITQLFKNISAENLRMVFHAAFKKDSRLSVYELIPFLDKPEYNVLHAHFGPNGVYVAELKKLGLFKHSKFITTFHGYDLHPDYGKNRKYQYLFVCCDRFTVNTKYSRKLLVELGCDEKKIEVLPVGLNSSKFKRNNSESDDNGIFKLLFIGRLVEFKAPDLFIEICRLLKERTRLKFSATIIGAGPMLENLKKLNEGFALQDQVAILEGATQEEIHSFMNKVDLFVFPGITINGRAENQGLVIQEAQAMELPVLVSDAGGMAEGVLEGITGYVLPQRDVEAFVDKIEYLATNPSIRKQMGSAGRKFVEENYDSARLTNKLKSIYSLKFIKN